MSLQNSSLLVQVQHGPPNNPMKVRFLNSKGNWTKINHALAAIHRNDGAEYNLCYLNILASCFTEGEPGNLREAFRFDKRLPETRPTIKGWHDVRWFRIAQTLLK